jgi:hypothetical protein
VTQAECDEQGAAMDDAESYVTTLERLDALRVAVDALYHAEPPVRVRVLLSDVRGCLLEARNVFWRAIETRAAEVRRAERERG